MNKQPLLVIVGGTSGFGWAVAEKAAAAGMSLHLTGKSQASVDRVAEEISKRQWLATASVLDAHDPEAVSEFFKNIGTFDHLVSTVGEVNGGGFLDNDMASIRRVVDSKFFANLHLAKEAWPHFRSGGSLTFTSGTGGRAQNACGSYIGNLSINAMVEGLAVEMAPKVRVNSVCPTWTATPFWRSMSPDALHRQEQAFAQGIPLGRTATIDEVAQAYWFLVENSFVSGQHLAVDGGVMLGSR